MISLRRFYTGAATWGVLEVAAPPLPTFACATIELPWRNNEQRVSCIPEGEYQLRMRPSPVVQRSSGGEFSEGWEVCAVPGRTFIMLHPGNWADNVLGCIAMGRSHVVMSGKLAVSNSRDTFRDLMAALATRNEWTMTIEGLNRAP